MNYRRQRRVVRAIGVVTVAFLSSTPSPAAVGSCTLEQAKAAEAEADTLRSWRDIHASYVRYAQCDDGHIAEGYGESISLLLAKRWNAVPKLQFFIDKDAGFQVFVLRHLDEVVPGDRLAAIQAHARQRCPSGSGQLCERIDSTIQRLSELSKPQAKP